MDSKHLVRCLADWTRTRSPLPMPYSEASAAAIASTRASISAQNPVPLAPDEADLARMAAGGLGQKWARFITRVEQGVTALVTSNRSRSET